MKFEKYHISHEIKRSLETMGFNKPTDIQFKAIGPALKGDDILAIAQTGTGKTAAFVIPILDMLTKRKVNSRTSGIKAIVLAPTRELAVQINDVFNTIGKHLPVKNGVVYGGVPIEPQIDMLEKGVDILIATPGRLLELTAKKEAIVDRLQFLVLDEADKMLELGFYDSIKTLTRIVPKSRQTMFFSATIDQKIKELAYSLVNNPLKIHLSPKDPISKKIDHSVAFIEMDDKRFFLERILREHVEEKIMVFVRTKVRAERVKKALSTLGVEADTLHGDKDQKERQEALSNFRSGKSTVLIATDVSARGIDIPGIEIVINYDLPTDSPETYVHRVGRTGRGNKNGLAIAFCAEHEKEYLAQIEKYITKPVAVLEISKTDYQITIDTSTQKPIKKHDFMALIEEANQIEESLKKKKGKKKK